MPEHEGERYYWADGQKVGLTTSRRFVAVKADEDEERRGATALSVAPEGAQILDLPEYDLAVIALPDAGGTSAPAEQRFEAVRSAVAAAPEIASGPEIYETTEPGPEALIAIGEIIVKFKQDTSEDASKRLLAKHRLSVKQRDYPEPGADLLEVPSDRDPVTVANELHESDLVAFAEPNFVHLTPRPEERGFENGTTMIVTEAPLLPPELLQADDEAALTDAASALAGPSAPPTDPGFASQWGLKKIKAPEAWDISMGTPGISVAIIDEGCDLTHEDLLYKTPGYDAYDGDNNPSPLPADGHGTSCAGVAAAKANNAKGGAGVAPKCKVLPIRIAKGIGGGFWDTSSAKVADGIRKAVAGGADVLSNSYGVGPSSVVTNAFVYAQTDGRGTRGCPIAAASGNKEGVGVIYPARLSPTIRGFLAVGASNEWDQRKSTTSLDGESWWGSTYGPEVDVVAPGVHIYTTDIMGAAGYGGGNYIPNFNGTSSATPHVAGLMALILSVDPELRSWEVEDIIKLTADDIAPGGRDQQTGFGRINARRALEAASRIWYQITIGLEFLGAGKECFMRANVRMYNPGINTVRLDALTLTSHNPTWTAEVDRFEYRPNPGNVLAPRSSQDVRLNRILLKANGNQSAWSYRWSLNWNYTYWRPAAPGFPLGASEAAESQGLTVTGRSVRGGGDSSQQTAGVPDVAGTVPPGAMPRDGNDRADLVTIDRQTREIRIVIR